ncbi:Wzz/FepE/Etk N-terminal domain-containing protein [Flavobacteriales bacterium]|nr:Wzz/FepE/Etk N-terminal domain-containing protein [Flavobacteriales bacterium]
MSNKSNEFDSIDLISFLWKERKVLIILGILAVVVSSIVSLMMQEKFLSTVTLFPAKSSSITFSEVITEDQSVTKFGEEEEAEQMLQILESALVREKIITRFDLMKHYDIDTAGKLKYTELSETYSDNITFQRNNKGAVIINVLDHDKDTAALIANHISNLFDSTKNSIIHERALLEFEVKKMKLHKLQDEMNVLRDTMSKLTTLGVVTNQAYQGLTLAMNSAKGDETRTRYEQKLEMTEKYGSVLQSFQVRAEFLSERMATMETSYEQSESDAQSNISHKFVVELASPAEKKAYPIRWLIVAVSTFATVFFAIILLLFVAKIKELKANSK